MSLLEGVLRDYFSGRPDVQLLQKHVNDQMSAFEDREEDRKRQLATLSRAPDEEGFVTVVSRTGAAPSASGWRQGDAREEELPFEVRQDFYKFQTRQSRVSDLQELKQRFEADKLRLCQLRKDRLFES